MAGAFAALRRVASALTSLRRSLLVLLMHVGIVFGMAQAFALPAVDPMHPAGIGDPSASRVPGCASPCAATIGVDAPAGAQTEAEPSAEATPPNPGTRSEAHRRDRRPQLRAVAFASAELRRAQRPPTPPTSKP